MNKRIWDFGMPKRLQENEPPSLNEKLRGAEMSDDFDYDDVMRSYKLARRDDVEPTQVMLGYRQSAELVKDVNFSASRGQASSQIGKIAGVEATKVPTEEMQVLIAQKEEADNAQYYIL